MKINSMYTSLQNMRKPYNKLPHYETHRAIKLKLE